ncbi:PIN domain-containing protein [Pseudonocardia sp.]|uniref:type II toxin-antitoxin system VapC family toxin n=1 Tax=Pseudonocardia sp. TaxID=60912 RepID=UPI00261F4077|nr:PIN domain-containing protein [Pseudonocardia sp.]
MRADLPVVAVLDSEALSAVAFPRERGRSARRAQAVLTAVERMGGRACVPAPVIAEVARTPARRAAVDRVLSRLPVVDTDRTVATTAGELLGRHDLDSRHAVDAFVAATALTTRPSVVITGDPDDLSRLVGDLPGVRVRAVT